MHNLDLITKLAYWTSEDDIWGQMTEPQCHIGSVSPCTGGVQIKNIRGVIGQDWNAFTELCREACVTSASTTSGIFNHHYQFLTWTNTLKIHPKPQKIFSISPSKRRETEVQGQSKRPRLQLQKQRCLQRERKKLDTIKHTVYSWCSWNSPYCKGWSLI